jgi:esterase/lipase superfamily enzyme
VEEDEIRLALCNLLHRLARRYDEAAEALFADQLKPLFKRWSESRKKLGEATGLTPVDDPALAKSDRLDVLRRVASGRQALVELIRLSEDELRETVEDARELNFNEALLRSIDGSLAEVSRELSRVLDTRFSRREPPRPWGRSGPLQLGREVGMAALARPDSHIYEVLYGTNRRPSIVGGKTVGYSGQRDTQVHLGRCYVSIPKSHRVASTGSKWVQRLLHGDDRLRLDKVEQLDAEQFWDTLARQVKGDATPDDAVVFLHGYNVGFEAAAIRAAQIGADLGFTGAMAFFSWPSRGRVLSYVKDGAAIEGSEPVITDFLVEFAKRSSAKRVHLIAHSMGNRGLLRAVERIAAKAAEEASKPFGQIILAAPDVDLDLFRGLAGAYGAVGDRTTLYVSRADLAVRASRLFHGAPRVGFTPPVSIIEGIDTVNVTNVDLTLLGHGYVADSRDVLADMQQLIVNDTPPRQRAFLREISGVAGSHWEFAE